MWEQSGDEAEDELGLGEKPLPSLALDLTQQGKGMGLFEQDSEMLG